MGEYRVSGSWRYQGSGPVTGGGRCFLIGDGELECLDLSSDALIWKRSWGKETPGLRRLTPPALANGRLFLADALGWLRCLAQDTGQTLRGK